MKYAACIVPFAPVRTTPDHRAEMSTQYLFGENVRIIDTSNDGWIKLQNDWDGYTGWCRNNQFILSDQPFLNNTLYAGNWLNEIIVNGATMQVPFGAGLALLKDDIPGYRFDYKGKVHDASGIRLTSGNIRIISAMFLNTTYIWGGRSVFAIDCSGFVQMVYRMMNIKLLRDANQQVNEGTEVGFLQEAICGDLAFFDEADGSISHVGLLLNEHEIIHASGNVRIDPIDHEGIIHSITGKRTHHLRAIRRIAHFL